MIHMWPGENTHFLGCRRASHSLFECAFLLVTVQVFVLPLLSACLLSFYFLFFALFHLNFLWCVRPPSISCCQLFLSFSISYSSLSLFLLLSFPSTCPLFYFFLLSGWFISLLSCTCTPRHTDIHKLSFFFSFLFILKLVNIVIVFIIVVFGFQNYCN